MISSCEILKLVKKAQEGDEDAKNELIKINSPLIKSVIKRFIGKGVEYDDLFQLGCLGFVKALNNFDAKYEVKFSTYVVPLVIGEVKRFMRDDGAIKVSRSLKSANILINKFIDEFYSVNKIKPTVEDISKGLSMDEYDIVLAMDSSKMPISLYIPVDEGADLLVIDKVDSEKHDNSLIDKLVIKEALSTLCERDKQIILMRYFYDKTQSEIAKKLGISQVQVSRLENKILENIKQKMG